MFASLVDVCLEVISHLTDNEHLFVFHDAFAMVIFEESLNVILHFALGLLVHLVAHKLEARREDRWKHELERDCVVSRHELRHVDNIAWILEMQDLSLCFSLDLSLLLSSIYMVSLSVHPANFLSSLDLDHDLSCWSWNLETNIYCSTNHCTWIIDLTCCLHSQIPVFTAIARVNVSHL
jgi:hypothetical protein